MAVRTIRESPLRRLAGAWIPAYAGMTGGGAVTGTGNHKGCPYDGLAGAWIPAYTGMTGGGAVSGKGNHKGCPCDGLAGGYFQGKTRALDSK